MTDDLEREDLGLCVGCNQALRAGEVVTPWDDVVGHYYCHNPTSLERIPDLDSDPDCPPPFVLIGNPARYVALDVVRATLGDTSNGPEAADEIARLRAENEALREAVGPFAHAAFEADGYPDCEAFTLVLRPDDEDGLREQDDEPESLITAGQLRRARTALQKGSRHE